MSEYTQQSTNGYEIGWDDEISGSTSSYIILEEGDYPFTVAAFERGRYPGSQKIPPCNMAILTLAVETASGAAKVKYDLQLYSTMEWKLNNFFCAIGQLERGKPLRPRWNEVVGSQGRAHFKVRTYTKKDGCEGRVNEVERFYDYDPAQAAQTQPSGSGEESWMDLPQSTKTPWDAGKF